MSSVTTSYNIIYYNKKICSKLPRDYRWPKSACTVMCICKIKRLILIYVPPNNNFLAVKMVASLKLAWIWTLWRLYHVFKSSLWKFSQGINKYNFPQVSVKGPGERPMKIHANFQGASICTKKGERRYNVELFANPCVFTDLSLQHHFVILQYENHINLASYNITYRNQSC